MYISKPMNGLHYLAERSRRSTKLLWSSIPVEPIANDTRIDASEVPHRVRRRAYKLFEGDRKRGV